MSTELSAQEHTIIEYKPQGRTLPATAPAHPRSGAHDIWLRGRRQGGAPAAQLGDLLRHEHELDAQQLLLPPGQPGVALHALVAKTGRRQSSHQALAHTRAAQGVPFRFNSRGLCRRCTRSRRCTWRTARQSLACMHGYCSPCSLGAHTSPGKDRLSSNFREVAEATRDAWHARKSCVLMHRGRAFHTCGTWPGRWSRSAARWTRRPSRAPAAPRAGARQSSLTQQHAMSATPQAVLLSHAHHSAKASG